MPRMTSTELAIQPVEPRAKRTFSFFAPGIPKAQPRARSFVVRGKGGKVIMGPNGPIVRVHESGTAENWKSQIADAAKTQPCPFPPLSGPISMSIDFYFPRPKDHYRSNGEVKAKAPLWHTKKPDRDNSEKGVSDALKVLGVFDDDCQICAGEVTKRYARDTASWAYGQGPGAQVTIREL